MKTKEIRFDIETEKDDEVLKAYLRYTLRMLNIKNIIIYTEVEK